MFNSTLTFHKNVMGTLLQKFILLSFDFGVLIYRPK